MIYIAGDFNGRDPGPVVDAFNDLFVHDTPPTRGNNFLDLIITNMDLSATHTRIMPPLETDDRKKSDHSCLFTEHSLSKKIKIKWTTYQSRRFTSDGEDKFTRLLADETWAELYKLDGDPSELVEHFDKKMLNMMNMCFPLRKYKIRSTDPPWITPGVRKKIKDRKDLFKDNGRGDIWKEAKRETKTLIRKKKKEFIENFKEKASRNNDPSAYYKLIHMFKDVERPPPWNVCDLFPNEKEEDVAEKVADYYFKISNEYSPLTGEPHWDDGWTLEFHEVSKMLRDSKKPKSRVSGDILPATINSNCDLLAIPLTYIYNAVLRTGSWPKLWKSETLIAIPKCSMPQDLGQCRNLSCTPYFSKCLERFIFKRLTEETKLSNSQYGGRAGCGVDHFLTESWNIILGDLEDPGSASNMISLDFEKAFNRMDHTVCLATLKEHGASAMTVSIIRGSYQTARWLPRSVLFSPLNGTCRAEALRAVFWEIYYSPLQRTA